MAIISDRTIYVRSMCGSLRFCVRCKRADVHSNVNTQAIIVTEAKYKMKKAGKMFRQRDCESGNNSVPMQRVGNVC